MIQTINKNKKYSYDQKNHKILKVTYHKKHNKMQNTKNNKMKNTKKQ